MPRHSLPDIIRYHVYLRYLSTADLRAAKPARVLDPNVRTVSQILKIYGRTYSVKPPRRSEGTQDLEQGNQLFSELGRTHTIPPAPRIVQTATSPASTTSASTPSRVSPYPSHPNCVPSHLPAAKIRGHEARGSLLGGQLLDKTYEYQPYAGGYHHNQGFASSYPPGGGQATQAKMYRPNSLWTWSFVVVTSTQAAIVLAFEA